MKKDTLLRISVFLGLAVVGLHLAIKEGPDMEQVMNISNFVAKTELYHGKTAPEVSLELLDGSTFTLSEEVGKKVIVLNFFATWCEPCVEEVPELSRYYGENREKDFILVGVNAGESEAAVRLFAEQNKVSYPVGFDTDRKAMKAYGVDSFPTTVLIGADGTIQLYEMGFIANADVAFETLVEENLEIIGAGKGVSAERYLAALESQSSLGEEPKKIVDDVPLDGRALVIATSMYCPCGCDHDLLECPCKTGKQIRKKLAAMDFSDGRTDEEIIKELNSQYCKGAE